MAAASTSIYNLHDKVQLYIDARSLTFFFFFGGGGRGGERVGGRDVGLRWRVWALLPSPKPFMVRQGEQNIKIVIKIHWKIKHTPQSKFSKITLKRWHLHIFHFLLLCIYSLGTISKSGGVGGVSTKFLGSRTGRLYLSSKWNWLSTWYKG